MFSKSVDFQSRSGSSSKIFIDTNSKEISTVNYWFYFSEDVNLSSFFKSIFYCKSVFYCIVFLALQSIEFTLLWHELSLWQIIDLSQSTTFSFPRCLLEPEAWYSPHSSKVWTFSYSVNYLPILTSFPNEKFCQRMEFLPKYELLSNVWRRMNSVPKYRLSK